jgi:hypothetical protein
MAAMQVANAAKSSAPKMLWLLLHQMFVLLQQYLKSQRLLVLLVQSLLFLQLRKRHSILKQHVKQFREDRKSGALKENVQAQKKNMRVALKSGVVPKEARKSLRDEIKNTNVKSVAQGVRSRLPQLVKTLSRTCE